MDVARIIGDIDEGIALDLDGGDGIDVLSFAELNVEDDDEGVEFNLGTGEIASIKGAASESTAANFEFVIGSDANDAIVGSDQSNIIQGGEGTDDLTGGGGVDLFVFQTAGQDSIKDFEAGEGGDVLLLDNPSFQTASIGVNFVAIDAAETLGGAPVGNELGDANVVVVLNTDDDDDPTTVFNARSAAQQLSELTEVDEGGIFVYFNSGLGVNRVVFSENLNDADAELQVIARLDDTVGSAVDTVQAEEQLNALVEDNFFLSLEAVLLV